MCKCLMSKNICYFKKQGRGGGRFIIFFVHATLFSHTQFAQRGFARHAFEQSLYTLPRTGIRAFNSLRQQVFVVVVVPVVDVVVAVVDVVVVAAAVDVITAASGAVVVAAVIVMSS